MSRCHSSRNSFRAPQACAPTCTSPRVTMASVGRGRNPTSTHARGSPTTGNCKAPMQASSSCASASWATTKCSPSGLRRHTASRSSDSAPRRTPFAIPATPKARSSGTSASPPRPGAPAGNTTTATPRRRASCRLTPKPRSIPCLQASRSPRMASSSQAGSTTSSRCLTIAACCSGASRLTANALMRRSGSQSCGCARSHANKACLLSGSPSPRLDIRQTFWSRRCACSRCR